MKKFLIGFFVATALFSQALVFDLVPDKSLSLTVTGYEISQGDGDIGFDLDGSWKGQANLMISPPAFKETNGIGSITFKAAGSCPLIITRADIAAQAGVSELDVATNMYGHLILGHAMAVASNRLNFVFGF